VGGEVARSRPRPERGCHPSAPLAALMRSPCFGQVTAEVDANRSTREFLKIASSTGHATVTKRNKLSRICCEDRALSRAYNAEDSPSTDRGVFHFPALELLAAPREEMKQHTVRVHVGGTIALESSQFHRLRENSSRLGALALTGSCSHNEASVETFPRSCRGCTIARICS